MKFITVVLTVCLLWGCSSYSTLEELVAEAEQTGDWSEVEERERILVKRAERHGALCSKGEVYMCEKGRCSCLPSESLDKMVDGLMNRQQ
jgi:hypothetical protein